MEAEAFLLGIWENFEEMELTLTIEELEAILKAKADNDMRHWRFQASLKGIDLDKEAGGDSDLPTTAEKMEEIRARLAGVDEDTYALEKMGIRVERD